MNNPEVYNKHHGLQQKDATDVLEEYVPKLKWKIYGDRVIDVGCGDGSTTARLLRRYMPHDFEKLVGCDKSAKMVEYANQHFGDEKISFTTLDVAGELPPALKENFDHVISLHALHWVRKQEQEKAFTTIYNLLDASGECLLTFLGCMPVFDVYRFLAGKQKWRHWMQDYERFISPYHDTQEPGKEVHEILEKIGFKNINVEVLQKTFVFDGSDDVKRAIEAVNPFPIPKEKTEEFLEDYVEGVKELRYMDRENNNEPVKVKVNYILLVVHACK